MSKALQRLRQDHELRAIVERGWKRDQRYGSGDSIDFALLVADETRKALRGEQIVTAPPASPSRCPTCGEPCADCAKKPRARQGCQRPKIRRAHSGYSGVRCDICAPLRCSKAKG